MTNITYGEYLHTLGTSPLSVTADGALFVSLAASEGVAMTFHDAATAAPANGSAFTVGGHKVLLVDIDRSATSATIQFLGVGPGGVARSIMGTRLADGVGGTSTTGAAETWRFDVSCLTTVTMQLSAIVAGAGSVTVKGRATA